MSPPRGGLRSVPKPTPAAAISLSRVTDFVDTKVAAACGIRAVLGEHDELVDGKRWNVLTLQLGRPA